MNINHFNEQLEYSHGYKSRCIIDNIPYIITMLRMGHSVYLVNKILCKHNNMEMDPSLIRLTLKNRYNLLRKDIIKDLPSQRMTQDMVNDTIQKFNLEVSP